MTHKIGEQLYYRAEGDAFSQGMPIHIIRDRLEDIQHLFDGTYLALVGEERVTAKTRKEFQLVSEGIDQGSLDAIFRVVMEAPQHAPLFLMSAASHFSPDGIWSTLKGAFNLLKGIYADHKLYVARGATAPYSPTIRNEGGKTIVVGLFSKFTVAPVVYNTATQISDSVRDISRHIDGKNYRAFHIGKHQNREEEGIKISSEERDTFDVPATVTDDIFRVACEIYDFNKYKNSGRLEVRNPDSAVSVGKYRFEVAEQKHTQDYIIAMLRKEVIVRCRLIKEINPFTGADKIVRMQIHGIADTAPPSLLE